MLLKAEQLTLHTCTAAIMAPSAAAAAAVERTDHLSQQVTEDACVLFSVSFCKFSGLDRRILSQPPFGSVSGLFCELQFLSSSVYSALGTLSPH